MRKEEIKRQKIGSERKNMEYVRTEKHVGGCLIHFHTPTQKAFGACCATAHFDSSTDLINLLLAWFTRKYIKKKERIRELCSSVQKKTTTTTCVQVHRRHLTHMKCNFFFNTPPVNSPGRDGSFTRLTAAHSSSSMKTSKGGNFLP